MKLTNHYNSYPSSAYSSTTATAKTKYTI